MARGGSICAESVSETHRPVGDGGAGLVFEVEDIASKLENHYREMQDMEFTIERGKLWLLQTRDGKRTAQAAVRIAVDLAEEGLISKQEAIMRVTPTQVDFFLHPSFVSEAKKAAIDDGKLLWQDRSAVPEDRFATIHLVKNGDRVWMFNERGELIISTLSPAGFREISRTKLMDTRLRQGAQKTKDNSCD